MPTSLISPEIVRLYYNPPPCETISNLKQRRHQRMLDFKLILILSSLVKSSQVDLITSFGN